MTQPRYASCSIHDTSRWILRARRAPRYRIRDGRYANGGFMRDDQPSNPSNPTRRAFLRTTGSTAAAAVIAGCGQAQANRTAESSGSAEAFADGPNVQGAVPITLRINGKDRQLRVDPRATLLDCIRETV